MFCEVKKQEKMKNTQIPVSQRMKDKQDKEFIAPDRMPFETIRHQFRLEFDYPNNHSNDTVQRKGSEVIQKKDKYIPNTGQPHLHIHNNGITFKSVSGRHADIVVGDQVRTPALERIVLLLSEEPSEQEKAILDYLRSNECSREYKYDFAAHIDSLLDNKEQSTINMLRNMLIEMGGATVRKGKNTKFITDEDSDWNILDNKDGIIEYKERRDKWIQENEE